MDLRSIGIPSIAQGSDLTAQQASRSFAQYATRPLRMPKPRVALLAATYGGVGLAMLHQHLLAAAALGSS